MRWLLRAIRSWLIVSGLAVNLLGLAMLALLVHYGPTATLVKLRDTASSLRPQVEALARQADRRMSLAAAGDEGPGPAEPAFIWHQPGALLPPDLGYGRVIPVGSAHELKRPSEAARIVRPGDIVEIEAGVYAGDSAVWRASDLVIRARGGLAHLDAKGAALDNLKGIWVIQGSNVRIEGIRFSGAAVPDRNGAGIRAEGDRLHVIHSIFDGNENGILSNPVPGGTMLIEFSEFTGNGHVGGQAHQVYIGKLGELTMRGNYLHNARVGSNIKSRASLNRLHYNRIVDGRDGRASYLVDLSNGGRAFLVGNQLQQGPNAENFHLIAFAPEGGQQGPQELWLVHNTLVNDRHNGVFVRNFRTGPVYLYNNLLVGRGTPVQGEALLVGNVHATPARGTRLDGTAGSRGNRVVRELDLTNRAALDYRPLPGSPAAGAALPALAKPPDEDLQPGFEYLHPLALRPRPLRSPPDAGALDSGR